MTEIKKECAFCGSTEEHFHKRSEWDDELPYEVG